MSGDDVSAAKRELRRQALKLRRAIAPEVRREKSRIITEKLLADEALKRAAVVFAFASMADETDTFPLLAELLKRRQKVCLPLVVGRGLMEAVILRSLDDLAPDKYGIFSVVESRRQIVDPADIECVIVPGAAFSRDGSRVGMGGGFYDRFLPRAAAAEKIAAAFDCQIFDRIAMAAHDVPVDRIFTETAVIDCDNFRRKEE